LLSNQVVGETYLLIMAAAIFFSDEAKNVGIAVAITRLLTKPACRRQV